MSKKLYTYDIIDRKTGKVQWTAKTREHAREEKRFLESFDGIKVVIRQNVYIQKEARNIR